MRSVGRLLVAVAALSSGIALAGCTSAGEAGPAPTQTAWTVQPTPGSTSSGTAFDPHGTAAQNQGAFDAVIQGVLAKNPSATGQQVSAALERAGFAKAALQFSASRTSVNLAAGSVMLAAEVGKQCLIAQWGTAVGGYHSAIAPRLAAGGCLVGGGGLGTSKPTGSGSLGD